MNEIDVFLSAIPGILSGITVSLFTIWLSAIFEKRKLKKRTIRLLRLELDEIQDRIKSIEEIIGKDIELIKKDSRPLLLTVKNLRVDVWPVLKSLNLLDMFEEKFLRDLMDFYFLVDLVNGHIDTILSLQYTRVMLPDYKKQKLIAEEALLHNVKELREKLVSLQEKYDLE